MKSLLIFPALQIPHLVAMLNRKLSDRLSAAAVAPLRHTVETQYNVSLCDVAQKHDVQNKNVTSRSDSDHKTDQNTQTAV